LICAFLAITFELQTPDSQSRAVKTQIKRKKQKNFPCGWGPGSDDVNKET